MLPIAQKNSSNTHYSPLPTCCLAHIICQVIIHYLVRVTSGNTTDVIKNSSTIIATTITSTTDTRTTANTDANNISRILMLLAPLILILMFMLLLFDSINSIRNASIVLVLPPVLILLIFPTRLRLLIS